MRVTLKLSSYIAIFKSVFSKQIINVLNNYNIKKIVLPTFVDTNDQYTASMLTGDTI